MTKFGMVCFAIALGITSVVIANAQEAPIAPATAQTEKAPTWQAICGYKWRTYRMEHPSEGGRDAYLEFMRKPSAEGGCGAGENAAKPRPAKAKPGDDKLKQWIETHKAKAE